MSVTQPSPVLSVLLLDQNGTVLRTEPPGSVVLSRPPAAVPGCRISDLALLPFSWKEVSHTTDCHLYWSRECESHGTEGPFPVELSLMPFSGEEKNAKYLAVLRDLRDRVRQDSSMQANTNLFRQVAGNLSEVLWVLDLKTRIPVYVSPAFEKVWGHSCQTFYRNAELLFECMHPDDRERVKKLKDEKAPGIDVEYRILRSDGAVRWVRERSFPIADEQGDVYRELGMVSDVTRFKEAARKATQQREQLIQADKMSSLGVLVAGVAHEVNNPNNLIQLNLDLVERVWQDSTHILDDWAKKNEGFLLADIPYDEMRGEIAELLAGMREGSVRIANIVRNLKDYARMEGDQPREAVSVEQVIDKSILIIENKIKKTTNHFTRTCAEDIPPISGSFQRFEQVIINLLLNACQSLGSRDKSLGIHAYYDGDADRVTIRVSDEGCGMNPEQLEHLFEPFYTTKQDRGGTGLGLSVTYGIIQEFGGELRFSSTEGRGTIATLLFPPMEKS